MIALLQFRPDRTTGDLQAERFQAERFQAERFQAEQFQAEQFQAEQFQAEQFQAEQFQAEQFQAEQFQEQAEQALRLLAERPGFVRGSLARATDDAGSWLLFTEWESVGAYRRGLGGYQVKLLATPLLSQALDQPSAFEELLRIDPDGSETVRTSDRAADADWAARLAGGPDQPAR